MKKILSLVLVLSMVLGSLGFAFAAPADVEGTDYEDAVTRLVALEILSGFPDGTFRPNETITRAQFAKIMVTALGVGEAAQYAGGQTLFSDVAANHWAAGYINVASDMKIINGYGDGNFGPEDQVTYAQAVTMIVRALGYEPKATAMGGYPGGYLAVGAEKNITEDVNIVDAMAATRGDVAKMVDASLTVPMMVQTSWGEYPEYEEDENKTLMTTKLGVDEIKSVDDTLAIVTAVPNTDSSLEENEIKINGKDYKLLVDADYDALLGLEVTAWADDDEIVFLEIETDEDDILFDSVAENSTKDEVKLYVDDEGYQWAKGAKAYVNFEEVDVDEIPANAYGYFVFNDSEEVAYANLFEFGEVEAGVVFDADGDVFKYVDRDGDDNNELDLADYEDGVFVYNEKMQAIDKDQIKENSAIYGWEDSDELYLIVINKAVNGELNRVKDDQIQVDEEAYDRHASNGAVYSDDKFDSFGIYDDRKDLDNLNGETVTVVLDLNGEVQLIFGDSEATSGTMYGIVTYGEAGSKSEATVFTKEDEVNYEFETRADGSRLEDLQYFENQDSNNGNDDLSFAAMEFKLNSDGEISDGEANIVELVYAGDNLPAAAEGENYEIGDLTKSTDSDRLDVQGHRYYISEDTVFMTALDSNSKDEGELDPAVIDYEEIYENAIEGSRVLVFGDQGKDAEMIVFLDKDFEGADDDVYYGVVLDQWTTSDNDMAKIDVAGEGVNEYAVKDEDDFQVGDLVAFKLNTDNKAVLASEADNQDVDEDGIKYNDGWVEDLNDSEDRKLDTSAVIYEDDTDELENKVARSKVDNYEVFKYLYNDEGIIVAAIVSEESDEDTQDNKTETGVVSYINTSGTKIAVDGTVYTLDEDTTLYDAEGNLIAIGNTDIKDNIVKNQTEVNILEVEDGVVVELSLVEEE
ncbi:S-layer homology domain-containing protein [Maledivibacter halophilus]|uniref:S-layer homology domain-containing protein n=1 Tax=Maledivibacter halophilus TaxID=36842 RepID=A0A1T5K347_9FIRM|nr:S-layer homology domain-containing protein [Maledivibacter halophilus]SKC58192.1 S-layer homology domain-containing protein [Maledivibacter halophilus]